MRKISLVILTTISLTSFAGSLNDKYERINRMGSQLDRIEQKLDMLLHDDLKLERSVERAADTAKKTFQNTKDITSDGLSKARTNFDLNLDASKEFINQKFEEARDKIAETLNKLSDNIKSPNQ